MDKTEVFRIWAPPNGVWSPWVKPVLFAWLDAVPPVLSETTGLDSQHLRYIPRGTERCVMIVDLPGATSLRFGLELAKRGFRPVPLYNSEPGPAAHDKASFYTKENFALLDVRPILSLVWHNAECLQSLQLPSNAPPAFLLDANRYLQINSRAILADANQYPPIRRRPNYFDNRWLVFFSDFPSSEFLAGQGLKRVIVIQREKTIRQDLAEAIRLWQTNGLTIELLSFPADTPSSIYVVKPPSFFERLTLRLQRFLLFGSQKEGFGQIRTTG